MAVPLAIQTTSQARRAVPRFDVPAGTLLGGGQLLLEALSLVLA
jgi:hypothetical protein